LEAFKNGHPVFYYSRVFFTAFEGIYQRYPTHLPQVANGFASKQNLNLDFIDNFRA